MNVYQCLLYESLRGIIGPPASLLLKLKCEGTDNVPRRGGALIVGNHRNPVLDPISIARDVDRPINFVAASVAFKLPVVSQLFRGVGAMPMDVFGGRKSQDDMNQAVRMLEEGELVGVFPEGIHTIARLNSVSKIHSFRTGFVRIALRARVPLVPVAVIGLGERYLPRIPRSLVRPFFDHPDFKDGVRWSYYKRVHVRIGRPIELGAYLDQPVTKALIDEISGKLRRVIIKLYDGEDLDRFLTGETPFDIYRDRV